LSFLPVVAPGILKEGSVDYRLARQAVVRQYRAGHLGVEVVCDAHPELRRAAEQCSLPTKERCPICEDAKLVLVRYVFGPRLPPYGRCIINEAELTRLAQRKGTFTCYVVEVCPSCAWNHLRRAYVLSP
jgi:ssDNA-binding Zn-finger/Zn-ribbon topoisomerase 1